MITQNIIKLKKYLFLISILFLFITLSHLIYTYLYENAKTIPVKGGTISEGLIGNFPSLNPIKKLSGNNKYIINLLYRSLLKYDLKQQKIVGDITTCDISSLANIECYINDDTKWSNGEKITAQDIVGTYELIKTTKSNNIISSLLEDTKIEYEDNIIRFKNSKEDINFLNIFFQPIISKETIDNLSKNNIYGNFPSSGGIYSGNFKISNISSDLSIGVSKIILDRNENNVNGNISKIILNIFPNINTFLKNKQSVNIFNDNDNIIGDSTPRLQSNKYTLPQFVGLFINQNKIQDKDFRNFIFNKINSSNLIELLGKENFKEINNPYLSDEKINKDLENKNFESIIESLGYKKKSKIIDEFLPKKENNIFSQEAQIEKEIIKNEDDIKNDDIKNDSDLTIDKFQEDSKYIKTPEYVDKYNFITKDNILLQGNTSSNVESVYINDLQLSNFKKGDKDFYYRLKVSNNTLKEGENNLKVYFIENGKKSLKEEINFLYYPDKNQLDIESKIYIKNLYEQEKLVNLPKTEELIEIDKSRLNKISKLDENMYYDKDLNSFNLKLYYLNSEKELEQTAYFIQNSLKELGITTELIPIDISNIGKILSNKDSYDMILTGVNLGYFNFNIFPYFHSSQVKNGYNFANFKKPSLDILLEELKSNINDDEKIIKIQEKILKILKDEQIIKTLYTPKINLLIDKNLKNTDFIEELPNKSLRSYILNSSYIKDEKIINFKNKSFLSFLKFLGKKIYE